MLYEVITRVGVSSFGFGGSNFHLTLEEYRGPGKRALRKRTAAAELLVFGAATSEALAQALSSVEVGGPGSLRHLAQASQQSCPKDAAARVAIVASGARRSLRATTRRGSYNFV